MRLFFKSSGVYICKSVVNDLKHGNYICKSEGIYLDITQHVFQCLVGRWVANGLRTRGRSGFNVTTIRHQEVLIQMPQAVRDISAFIDNIVIQIWSLHHT